MTLQRFALVSALLIAGIADAATPVLTNLRPQGLQRGTEMEVVLNGARFTDAKELLFYQPGVTVVDFKVVNDAQVKVKLKAAPDCRLGEHAVRLVAASGISELRTFYVGPLPLAEEKEPNNELGIAQAVPLNATVCGIVQSEDVDYFKVTAKKGQRLSVEVEGMRLGNTNFDPSVSILDKKRFALATSDDHILLNQDPACSVIVPEDGEYFIELRETSYRGDGNCYYRMHVGTFPRPTAAYPAGGKVGEALKVKFLGDVAGPFEQEFKLPAAPNPKHGLFPESKTDGVAPSPCWARVFEGANVLEAEPNDEIGKATPTALELPLAFNGIIEKQGDRDFFKFKAKKGQVFDVTCFARSIRSPLDPVLHIHQADGKYLAGSDDAVGPDSYIRFSVPADGEYCIHLHDHLLKGGADYVYRVEFSPVKAKLTSMVPEFAQYQQDRRCVAVARGSKMATLIQATRADFGGDLKYEFKNLPKGVTATMDPMHSAVATQPVVFEAAKDAPLGAMLVDVVGSHVDPKQGITGGFSQDIGLVYGEPNTTLYWKYTAEKLAMAVVEELPYTVSIIEPKAPLGQDGNMKLKVKVERKAGFKGAVSVYNIFNPPGVSSVPGITINADKTEGDYDFSATRGAEARSWKLVFQAVSDAGKGPIWCSTQFATLKIVPPYTEVAIQMAATEQGKPTEVVCKLDQKLPFNGKATLTLIGMPAHVTSKPIEITKEVKEAVFKVEVGKDAPAGQHKALFCQMVVTENGEPVSQNLGMGGVLRIDPPPPPKKEEPKAAAAPAKAATPAPAAAAPKRLSRLEQLRLEQAEKAKAAAGK
jgi:hypothetical protein